MSTVMRFTPFAAFDAGFESAFDDLVRRTLGETDAAAWMPAADVVRDGADAVITLELPGVAAGDVEIEVRDRALVVSGRRDMPSPEGSRSPDDETRILRQEIRRGQFSRGFRLPGHVTADSVRASYDNGMLVIRVAGVQPTPSVRRVPIDNMIETGHAIVPDASADESSGEA